MVLPPFAVFLHVAAIYGLSSEIALVQLCNKQPHQQYLIRVVEHILSMSVPFITATRECLFAVS